MIEHHIQRQILHNLVKGNSSFGTLKPKNIESNLFTYHLQQLIAHGYIEKLADGGYALTSAGKLEGIHLGGTAKTQLTEAHSIVLLAVRDRSGNWLLRRRLVEPLRGKIGFIHGEPVAGISLLDSAARIFERRTGLHATFDVRGSGYICQTSKMGLESFSHFTLLSAAIEHTELNLADETGENIWVSSDALSRSDMLASMPTLVNLLNETTLPSIFFADLQFTV